MKKFNSLFVAGKTKVKIGQEWSHLKDIRINFDENTYMTVKSVHESRQWITVQGFVGSFQRGHIKSFTNK